MEIIPAIDLKDGGCVRLRQGRMDDDTLFSDDPAAVARRWRDAGAAMIHLVDLNGAFTGAPVNRDAIAAIIAAVDIPCQIGGGIRSLETIAAYLKLGLERVILGTAAVENEALVAAACKRYPGKICISIDARGGRVATRGWAVQSECDAVDLARAMARYEIAAIIYTDIMRDGMRSGVNLEETARLAAAVDLPVIASGGIATIADVRRLKAIEPQGVTAAISGRALYEGTLDLAAALAVARG
jgi:phosphoribosylformimino-5-aminoimidazole carboxamide ribotide isomerase